MRRKYLLFLSTLAALAHFSVAPASAASVTVEPSGQSASSSVSGETAAVVRGCVLLQAEYADRALNEGESCRQARVAASWSCLNLATLCRGDFPFTSVYSRPKSLRAESRFILREGIIEFVHRPNTLLLQQLPAPTETTAIS